MKQTFVFIVLLIVLAANIQAQELQAKLTVIANRVSSQTDKKVFVTLQTALTNFVNSRKWTNDSYQPQERVNCNFLLTINEDKGNNVYQASLTVQAARPIYNTTYESPIINFVDNDIIFRYVEFQPVEFNENRVQGNDPLVANLPAILAFYADIILGMDYDSFAPRGGDPYFQRALNIVNNAPESRDIVGWKTFDGLRNRYQLINNFTDNRFNLVHDAIYNYYRAGLDLFYDNEKDGRTGILNALNFLSTINQDNPNSMVMQFFFSGKSTELIRIFSHADTDAKGRARDMLTKLDITNIAAYKELK